MLQQKKTFMSSAVTIETQKQHAVDVEKSIKAVVKELQHRQKTPKTLIFQNHRIKYHLEQIQQNAQELLELFLNPNRKAELNDMTSESIQKTLGIFDARLSETKEYLRKFANIEHLQNMIEKECQQQQSKRPPLIPLQKLKNLTFSGEEGYGRFLDLHKSYNEFLSVITPEIAKNLGVMDYFSYLDKFYEFQNISLETKNEEYATYLHNLHNYLVDFYSRSQPLSDLSTIFENSDEDFEQRWKQESIPGWELFFTKFHKQHAQAVVKQEEEEEEKEEEIQNNKNNSDQHKKKRRRKRKRNEDLIEHKKNCLNSYSFAQSIAFTESRITRFAEVLQDIIEATKVNLEKKLTKTWEEITAEAEREENEQDVFEDQEKEEKEEEEDTIGSNPLNLPIGWDGKPIPYWLYKLHGLGVEYKCEICGNYSYWGPRAFEKHFQEWRHAHGMRCLRIPNTRHFNNITKISDAVALWENIKQKASNKNWKQELEEFEDAEGNVYDKKMYEDLKRQGIIE